MTRPRGLDWRVRMATEVGAPITSTQDRSKREAGGACFWSVYTGTMYQLCIGIPTSTEGCRGPGGLSVVPH